MAKVIPVVNQKGGVGKTTTTVNLSACLALKGYKVLVIDLDPQGNCSSSFGVDKDTLGAHAYHLLVSQVQLSDVIYQTEIESLHIVPTNMNLAGAEVELVTEMGREGRLSDALHGQIDDYDLVFVDCPPSLGLITLNALTSADGLLVPLQCEYFSLEGVSQLLRTLEIVQSRLNPKIELNGVILTMFDRRNKLSFQVQEEVQNYFGELLFETAIPRNVRLSESPSHGKPIALYDKRSKGAIAYDALADEMVIRLGLNLD
jgi:chromosome partitioning protein